MRISIIVLAMTVLLSACQLMQVSKKQHKRIVYRDLTALQLPGDTP